MAKNNNQFKAQAKKKLLQNKLVQPLKTKGDTTNTILETGKDLVIGVVGGGLVGSAIGKPSLIIGVVTTGVGHYLDCRLLSTFGLGMMASNGLQQGTGAKGMSGAKERAIGFKDGLLQKTYLDKVKAFQPKQKSVSGIDDVQYFSYPQTALEGANDDFALLNQIEHQLNQAGMQMSNMQGLEMTPEFEDAIY